jgi:predicted transcriptional regulator of viral defense system
MTELQTQRDRAVALLTQRTMMRAHELKAEGVTAATLARAVRDGEIIRAGRGLYQLPDGGDSAHMALAEVSKRIPDGVICLVSALAYHDLTDQMPRQVWVAIGAKDWAPKVDYPKVRIVRLREPYLGYGVEYHTIAGVGVAIYSVAKSLADGFRNARLVDRSVAIESLRSAIDQRKATPAEIAQAAKDCGAWKIMRPYLEALVQNG